MSYACPWWLVKASPESACTCTPHRTMREVAASAVAVALFGWLYSLDGCGEECMGFNDHDGNWPMTCGSCEWRMN